MGHRPYPNAERARAQLSRHADETAAYSNFALAASAGSAAEWVQVPEGWSTAAAAKMAAPFQAFTASAHRIQPPTLPFLRVAPGRAVLPGGISVEVEDNTMTLGQAVERALVTISNPRDPR